MASAGFYKTWSNIQRNLFPLAALNHMESLLYAKKAKNILDLGADLTCLGLFDYAKNCPEASLTVFLPRRCGLKSAIQAGIKQLTLTAGALVEADKALPWLVPVKTDYDCVRLLSFSGWKNDVCDKILDAVVPKLAVNALLVIHPMNKYTQSLVSEAVERHFNNGNLSFEIVAEVLFVIIRHEEKGSKVILDDPKSDISKDSVEDSVSDDDDTGLDNDTASATDCDDDDDTGLDNDTASATDCDDDTGLDNDTASAKSEREKELDDLEPPNLYDSDL